jgi:hypothetical protein
MPNVRKLHEESIKNLGKGTRRELGQVRRDDFRDPPKDSKSGKSKGGKG